VDGEPAPTRKHEYLFYQTLGRAWPVGWNGKDGRADFEKRLVAYLEKAGKEAKEVTSWTNSDTRYDEAVATFVKGALASDALMDAVRRFVTLIGAVRRGERPGRVRAQALLAGYSGHVSGRRALEPEPGRSRQPAPVEYGRRATHWRRSAGAITNPRRSPGSCSRRSTTAA